MSFIDLAEKAANAIGRIKGQYEAGVQKVANPFSSSWTQPSLTDPSAWIDPVYWGAALKETTKPMTKQQYINYFTSWVYICVKLNGQGVAATPLRLYVAKETKGKTYKTIQTRPIQKTRLKWLSQNQVLDSWLTKAEEVEEVTEHPFLDLMKNVNSVSNAFDLWQYTVMFLDLTGECYWYLLNNKLGIPAQIWPIPSQFITPKAGKSLDDPIEAYVYERGSIKETIPKEQVVMFLYPNPNNLFQGFSTIRGLASAVYLNSKMNDFEESLIENRARPGGILVPKTRMPRAEYERVTQQFSQKYAGAAKAGRTLIPPADMEFIRDAMTPEEINFPEGRRFTRTEIMAGLDVPEAVVVSESSNRAVAEAAEYRHAKYGILPRCRRVEEKLNEKLLPLYDEKLFCAFDDPVPENKELKLQEHRERLNRSRTINEMRAEDGEEPIEGGDDLYIDAMQVPVASTAKEGQIRTFADKVIEVIEEKLG